MSEGLSYFIPHHGRPKISLRIPESHSLHVCPAACGRRSGIRAIRNGTKEHVSFLYITEADVSSGGYEDMVGDAVADLLELLSPRPRAFQIYVNCIDDFLGTDEDALVAGLEARFPDTAFAVFHIDPVAMDGPIPPGMRQQERLYSFLRPREKDGGVNLLGTFVQPDPASELYPFLRACGVTEVRSITDRTTYEDYQQMAASRLDLVLMQMGRFAAQKLEERLGIPWRFLPATYDLDQIRANYQTIADALGAPCPPLTAERQAAEQAIAGALGCARDLPVVVDSSAAMQPFALAAALHRYGFQLRAVYAAHWKETDRADRDWLTAQLPDLPVLCSERYEDITACGIPRNCLAIGYDSAYLLRARHFVDIQRDEGLFGYHGVVRLMERIAEAALHTTSWR
ncbi:nitrogenase component 1 [Pseudoflavonifractor sp. MSJ-37]|uniref:nitrogenase component 1 n=1 Tax=Pseudoflavonifractor sp. MSJ-37 TaxID=2841531 RepID=UPI001C0FAB5B|nr:nitrogenase component 1 [Pseudoflavonifractor sp. MSJ-37]MBU5434623.1 nitrogenase component 1 [Pseudoflavonifractor sp. MSJ-37]